MVDVFDFGPSFKLLEYLASELQKKPKALDSRWMVTWSQVRVRIIANKVDLLPKDTSRPRLRGWVAREAQLAGLKRIRIMDVFPISCHNGAENDKT